MSEKNPVKNYCTGMFVFFLLETISSYPVTKFLKSLKLHFIKFKVIIAEQYFQCKWVLLLSIRVD